MNSFSNNLEKNEINFEYSNSLIHILYSTDKELNKRSYFKLHNDVIISYTDNVINKTIYVSSSGLKRNTVFTSGDFDKILAKKQLTTFVSYFKIFEDKFFRFDLYPQRYKKTIEISFLKKQGLIQKINRKSLLGFKPVFRSKYFNKHIFLNQKYIYNATFDKKIIVKLGYREIFVLTSRGVLSTALEPTNYNTVTIMTGLFFIFKEDMKKMITTIFLSSYILLRFFIKSFQNKKRSINLFLNILIYYYFAKFNFNSFFEKREEMKIGWKKSNKFIWRFFLRIQKKFNRYTNLFFHLASNIYTSQFFNPQCLNNLPLIKNSNIFEIANNYKFLSLKNEIISVDKTIEILNYLIKNIPLYLINIINFSLYDLKNIHIYFLYKTLLLKEYLISKFENLKLFKLKKIVSYINNLVFGKGLMKLNDYPEDFRCLVARRLYWVEVFVPPLNKVFIRTRITSKFHRKVKKKFINKVNVKKVIYSNILNEYINNTFLKFYKIYNLAFLSRNDQYGIIFKNLNKLIRKKVQKFTKRHIIRKKYLLKLFYKLLKKKKSKRWKWKNNYRKWLKYLKFKKVFKNRRHFILKYPKRKKNRIFSFKALLIKKLKLETPTIIIPKITRVRRYSKEIS